MEVCKLENTEHSNFPKAWALYTDAFPEEERRLINSQSRIMTHDNYHFDLIFRDDYFLGILLWWEFDDLRYIEHFATLPHYRGKGYGQSILTEFIKRDSKLIILELELPDTAINKRRIQFYKRLGFHLSDHFYQQPPYRKNGLPIQLLLMSHPLSLTDKQIIHFVRDCHPIIYGELQNK